MHIMKRFFVWLSLSVLLSCDTVAIPTASQSTDPSPSFGYECPPNGYFNHLAPAQLESLPPLPVDSSGGDVSDETWPPAEVTCATALSRWATARKLSHVAGRDSPDRSWTMPPTGSLPDLAMR